jgi:hypothetical protein
MSKRKIFESQLVDYETGEIKSVFTRSVIKDEETFVMGRTTEGLDWIKEFNNLVELQLLLIMLELENPKNDYIVSFSGLQVKNAAELLEVSEIYIRKSLTSLLNKNFIRRIYRGNYLVNPLTFYKGGTKVLKHKTKIYFNTDKIENTN